MCGFVGFMPVSTVNQGMNLLSEMTNSIAHRGPDSAGLWVEPRSRLYLGHRRLSILDLSDAGRQPMVSKTHRYVIVFNGEIYNHLFIREKLNKLDCHFNWTGMSDTETILAAIEAWGVHKTLNEMTGMFSFALWDNKLEELTLARDRFGEKPLYYGWQGQGSAATLLFGSELKSLRKHPSFEQSINRGALALYLRHNYVPAPYSIFNGIFKLPAGTYLVFSKKNFFKLMLPEPQEYWSLPKLVNFSRKQDWDLNDIESIDELDQRLSDVVSKQMVSDVPIGAFLSGGVDSSVIVALMQKISKQSVKTFSIGFNQAQFNEAHYAKAIASHLNTQHTELYVHPSDALSVIPDLPNIYDEPFADSSQIPTFLVSKLAREKVTVALSGDAGDELFCGYNRYLMNDKIWRRLQHVPSPFRVLASKIILSISPEFWSSFGQILPGFNRYPNFGDKLHKGANVLSASTMEELYLGLISHWQDPAKIVIGGTELPTYLNTNKLHLTNIKGVEKMMLLDALTYLPDDILVKVDRAAMSNSLETRVPFLDHHLAEFVWSMPQNLKYRNGETKWVLRRVLNKYIPQELIDRPKMGFGIPLAEWLRGPLKEWASELIDPKKLSSQGFFEPLIISNTWSEHLAGKRNWSSQLWTILMFQAWLEKDHDL